MKIEGLWIYPVKSFRGLALQEMEILADGPRYDRQWMLVDPAGKFVTQRQYPKMATIQPRLSGVAGSNKVADAALSFDIAGRSFEIPAPTGNETPIKVWSHEGTGLLLDGPWNEALSEYLGGPVRLVTMNPASPRLRDSKWPLHFPDTAQFLLVNTKSLEDLNSKLEAPIPIDRFRANIQVTTERAWSEEEWTSATTGPILFWVRGPCTRCVMITTDQASGVVGAKQPLTALAGMKRTPTAKADFGIHLMAKSVGILRVGDELTHD